MTSTFSWLAHSDTERRKMLDAIDGFKESDTRDELGLGAIRDAFADLFFPGTSVVQTRARYFLFVPWMYLGLEARRYPSTEIDTRGRKAELSLIKSLKASTDTVGNIGGRAGESVQRLPSNVYWLGLGAWKIRLFEGSQDDYHRSLDTFHQRVADAGHDDDGELVDGQLRRNWHVSIPSPPADFPGIASFDLPRHEARFLSERLTFAVPGSLLAFLARRGDPTNVSLIWEHPQLGEMPERIVEQIHHAQLLAETMHGAAWLYNVLLAEERAKSTHDDAPAAVFRSDLAAWAAELEPRREAISRWSRTGFWQLVDSLTHVSRTTKAFVEAWLRLSPWMLADGGAGDPAVRELVRQREQQLKGNRARLSNTRALELWGGASGTGRIDFRWRAAQRLLTDIHAGLGRVATDA